MSHWVRSSYKGWLAVPCLAVLALAVACGAAATATPPAAIPTAMAPATTVPGGATPTAMPKPTAALAAATVNPGKLTIMVGDFGNERFERAFVPGGSGGANYGRIVGGFLISTNEKTELIPGIASKWGISADGLTWTFTIREGVKWHDGSDLTAQDVFWSLDHTFGPQAFEYVISSPVASVSRAMSKIELSGANQVSATSKTPLTFLAIDLSEAGSNWIHIVPKRAKLHDPEAEATYDKNPIGAGAGKLVKHVPTDMMAFERFDDYYYQTKFGLSTDRRLKFKSLDLRLVPEEATRVAAIRASEADIVPVSLATKKQVEAGGGRLVFGPEGVIVQVKAYGCYETKHPCNKKGVRQALNYAINKELIRDRLYSGAEVFQVKGWTVVTPSTIGYSTGVDPFPFDPAKARQLLADAGYPGGNGFGKLVVNTWPSTSMPFLVEGAQLAADSWRRELALDVEVKVGDSTAITARQKSGDLNGQLLWRDNESRSEAAGTLASSYGDIKSPTRMHEDPELFRMVQETFQIVDPDKRAEAQRKLYVRLAEESYDLGIGFGNIPWGVGSRVLTWQPFPLALYPSALHTITLK